MIVSHGQPVTKASEESGDDVVGRAEEGRKRRGGRREERKEGERDAQRISAKQSQQPLQHSKHTRPIRQSFAIIATPNSTRC